VLPPAAGGIPQTPSTKGFTSIAVSGPIRREFGGSKTGFRPPIVHRNMPILGMFQRSMCNTGSGRGGVYSAVASVPRHELREINQKIDRDQSKKGDRCKSQASQFTSRPITDVFSLILLHALKARRLTLLFTVPFSSRANSPC
jgi:hypothetical protein